jgi:alpha-mannosidase
MHDDTARVLARVERTLADRIRPAVHRLRSPLTIGQWEAPGEPVPFAEAITHPFTSAAAGEPWGRPWGTTWFHVTGTVPAEWPPGGDGIEVVVDLGFNAAAPGFQAEGLAFRPDGVVLKGIEPRNNHVPLTAAPGDPVDLFIEAAGNPDIGGGAVSFTPTPLGDPATAGTEHLYRLGGIDLRLLDRQVWELGRDLWTLTGLLNTLPEHEGRRADIARALDRAMHALDPWCVSATATAARAELAAVLARPAAASAHRVAAIGHAHIDSAWLWPVRETIRKCARTFANVLQLIQERPDLKFACSSAQQYAWIKEHYPELFERIRQQVAHGRFIPVGGMWVESDTNLPGGEALVRQFLAGTSFFLTEFGFEPTEVWLPDSFGYTAALPQIAVAAGKRAMLTQKLSWNDTNRMPHHSFSWEGIDGTRIFTHFPPVATYVSQIAGDELARAARGYAEKGVGSISLVPFGWGDGGGGPTREMMAAIDRTADLEGSPRVAVTAPVDFFAEAEGELVEPPVWRGELYLELHRGTYTSQARSKRANRRTEHLLREAELWATTAALRCGADYPYDELRRCWEALLLGQFHDILPGSSINWVYRQNERDLADAASTLSAVIERSLRALTGDGSTPMAANAGPFPVQGVAGLAVGPSVPAGTTSATTDGDQILVVSAWIRARLDRSGRLVSLVDVATGREFVPPGAFGNELQLFRDTPNRWDAWDIDESYRRNRIEPTGPVRIDLNGDAVIIDRVVGDSPVRQRVGLAPDRPAVLIHTTVDWRENQKLLKLAFAVDVHADHATSEIAFGHLDRPTHENTSWDAARFETCAHRWMRLAEPGAGLAVANDRVYGHDVRRVARPGGGTYSVLRQSLLRAPRFPDPHADNGSHDFHSTVRVAPDVLHAVREGYLVNLPPRHVRGERPVDPLVTVSNPAIVVEAVKLAEDRSGDVIVRIYEARGGRASGAVTLDGAASIRSTDLLERPGGSVSVEADTASLDLRPFEIVTLRARFR